MISRDNKQFLKYMGILFLAVILNYKLPYDSYSIIQYIIRPIKIYNGQLYLSGVVIIVLFFIGLRGIINLERFKNSSRILVFFLVVLLFLPAMNYTTNAIKSAYYFLAVDGLNGINLKEANLSMVSNDEILNLHVEVKVVDYSREGNEFKVRMKVPKSIQEYLSEDYIELNNTYHTFGRKEDLSIDESIALDIDENTRDKIIDTNWYFDNIEYELYNNEDKVVLIDRGN